MKNIILIILSLSFSLKANFKEKLQNLENEYSYVWYEGLKEIFGKTFSDRENKYLEFNQCLLEFFSSNSLNNFPRPEEPLNVFDEIDNLLKKSCRNTFIKDIAQGEMWGWKDRALLKKMAAKLIGVEDIYNFSFYLIYARISPLLDEKIEYGGQAGNIIFQYIRHNFINKILPKYLEFLKENYTKENLPPQSLDDLLDYLGKWRHKIAIITTSFPYDEFGERLKEGKILSDRIRPFVGGKWQK